MSIASESIGADTMRKIKKIETDARNIAKEHGVKVRKNPICGVDVTFPDGEKKRFFGWVATRNYLIKAYNLAD